MQYDFSKLNQPYLLDILGSYVGSREITYLEGSESTMLYVGDSMLFLVAEGSIQYVSGAPNHLSKRNIDLITDKLQSALTLHCTIVGDVE
jgi:hypothetical protein